MSCLLFSCLDCCPGTRTDASFVGPDMACLSLERLLFLFLVCSLFALLFLLSSLVPFRSAAATRVALRSSIMARVAGRGSRLLKGLVAFTQTVDTPLVWSLWHQDECWGRRFFGTITTWGLLRRRSSKPWRKALVIVCHSRSCFFWTGAIRPFQSRFVLQVFVYFIPESVGNKCTRWMWFLVKFDFLSALTRPVHHAPFFKSCLFSQREGKVLGATSSSDGAH